MKKSDIEDIRKAVEKWGKQGWLAITCEEGAELIQAAAKIIRGRKGRKKIIDEIADVAIVIEALKIIYGKEAEERIAKKMDRLRERVKSKKYKAIS